MGASDPALPQPPRRMNAPHGWRSSSPQKAEADALPGPAEAEPGGDAEGHGAGVGLPPRSAAGREWRERAAQRQVRACSLHLSAGAGRSAAASGEKMPLGALPGRVLST